MAVWCVCACCRLGADGHERKHFCFCGIMLSIDVICLVLRPP